MSISRLLGHHQRAEEAERLRKDVQEVEAVVQVTILERRMRARSFWIESKVTNQSAITLKRGNCIWRALADV